MGRWRSTLLARSSTMHLPGLSWVRKARQEGLRSGWKCRRRGNSGAVHWRRGTINCRCKGTGCEGLGAVWIQPLWLVQPGTYIFILRAVRSNWKGCARLYMRSRSWRVREPKSMLRASWGINSSAEAAGHHATHPAPAETCFLQSRLPLVRNEIILFPWDLLPFIPDQPYVWNGLVICSLLENYVLLFVCRGVGSGVGDHAEPGIIVPQHHHSTASWQFIFQKYFQTQYLCCWFTCCSIKLATQQGTMTMHNAFSSQCGQRIDSCLVLSGP